MRETKPNEPVNRTNLTAVAYPNIRNHAWLLITVCGTIPFSSSATILTADRRDMLNQERVGKTEEFLMATITLFKTLILTVSKPDRDIRD